MWIYHQIKNLTPFLILKHHNSGQAQFILLCVNDILHADKKH